MGHHARSQMCQLAFIFLHSIQQVGTRRCSRLTNEYEWNLKSWNQSNILHLHLIHLIYNFYLNFSIPLCSLLKSLLCVLFFYPTLLKVLPLLKNHIISYRISHLPPIINKTNLTTTCRLSTCQVTYNN